MENKLQIFLLFISTLNIVAIADSQGSREKVDRQLRLMGLPYQSDHIVDIDSSIGLVGGQVVEGEIEDPYRTLKGCLLFTAYNPNTIANPDTTSWIVGIYKKGTLVWYSDELGDNGMRGEIYGTKDLNMDGTVDILTEWTDTRAKWSYLEIYSWDGTQGKDITSTTIDERTGYPGIYGGYHSYDVSDLDGDGIMEIRSYPADGEDSINVKSWSWNGQEYGKWPNTPTLPFSSWLPAKNAIALVNCSMTCMDSTYHYAYTITSSKASKRRIENIHLAVCGKTIGYSFDSWHASGGDSFPIVSWDMIGHNYQNLIYPNQSKSGFIAISKFTPGINNYYIQSERGLMEIDYDLNGLRNDIVNNSTFGTTITPQIPPDSAFVVIDSIISYTRQSVILGWLAQKKDLDTSSGESTKDSIATNLIKRLQTIKNTLQQGDSVGAHTLLQKFLTKVDAEHARSTNRMSDECYALLRYNGEYLRDKLPSQ